MTKTIAVILGACVVTILIVLMVRSCQSTSKPHASVSINAVPWAEVFIKLPRAYRYIKPQKKHFLIPPDSSKTNPNVTPIRGGLSVPIGTTIKLVYQDTEQVFHYNTWKTDQRISHDFLKP